MNIVILACLALSQSGFLDGERDAIYSLNDTNYSFGYGAIRVKNLEAYDTVAIVKYQGQIAAHERDRFLGLNMQPLTPRPFAADLLQVQQSLKGNASGTIRAVYRTFELLYTGRPVERAAPPKENTTYIFFGAKAVGQKLRADMMWDAARNKQQDFPIYTNALANNEYMGLALFETHVPTLRVSSDPKAVFLYAVADAFKNADDRTVTLLCQAMKYLVISRSDEEVPFIEGVMPYTTYTNGTASAGWLPTKFEPIVAEAYPTLSDYGKMCVLSSLGSYVRLPGKEIEYLDMLERFDAEDKIRQFPRLSLYFWESAPSGGRSLRNITINRIVDMIFSVRSPALRKHILSNWIYQRPADQYVLKLIALLESPSVYERGCVLKEFAYWHRKDFPGVDLKPKGNWQDGSSAIENEEFLQQWWRTHPP